MKQILTMLLALSLVLSLFAGCARVEEAAGTLPPQTEAAETTVPATVPADGNPNDVTCKGSYTGDVNSPQVVARAGEAELTSGLLQMFYWAEAGAYRQGGFDVAPDFDAPLDTQPCPIDDSVNSWQQFFLKRALNTWHTVQALSQQGADEGLPTEEAFQPDPEKHAENMVDVPANRLLYGYYDHFVPNSMHQAYLDNIPAMLEDLAAEKGYASANILAGEAMGNSLENLEAFARVLNFGYMYYTNLTYEIAPDQEMIEAYAREKGMALDQEQLVNIRHILVKPEDAASEESWEKALKTAQELLLKWKRGRFVHEASFAEFTTEHSQDTGSAINGGAYRSLRPGQLPEELDSWCFAPERKHGDTVVLRSQQGCHILYFSDKVDAALAQAEREIRAQAESRILSDAREKYPMTVSYGDITLNAVRAEVSVGDILYPDVAHERFPEAPVYVQQDYPETKFGAYPIRTHGCGPTTLAMLASYMTDEAYTPPRIAKLYGKYSHVNGTDGVMFNYAPAELGFYFREKVHNAQEARQALEDGYIVVCVQGKGFWTKTGHYLLLENIDENGMVQVRDANILNYSRLEDHKNDRFSWDTIPPKAKGYWVYEKKVKTIPACSRCGGSEGLISEGYICEKCAPAVLRRGVFLNSVNEA